jgi:pantoate--beta-alanine ligase
MLIARTCRELDDAVRSWRRSGARVALVPTMGALHAGHAALLAAARESGARVITSIFVNPLQFGDPGDLARYPRDEAGDLQTLEASMCDAVWLPDAGEMYPPGDATRIDVGGPAEGWEGDARPGHFRGVATVVVKLFGQVTPDDAFFGEKDWQQLQVIRRAVADLAVRVRIVGVATLREPDGLAMSSRNRFLSADERAEAPLLYATLCRVADALRGGAAAEPVLADARDMLCARGWQPDYLALVDGPSLRQIGKIQSGARLIAAARLGAVRLLDNIAAD